MQKEWEEKKESFKVIDVRKLTGNFLPNLLNKAQDIKLGQGICVIQTFEPIPLYSAMADLGFDYITEKISDSEYHVYFYKIKEKEAAYIGTGDMPLKPTAILNLKKIDNTLADIVVNFWNLTWGKEEPAIDQKTKLLLSLANGVGARRFRQATRELVKGYSIGATVAELDELFSMFVWNGGVGTFASEIGPSSLFGAYQLIKTLEQNGKTRREVVEALMENFGENNPEVNVMSK